MNLFARFFRQTRPTAARRFDAAGGGRRATGFATFGRTQTEVSAAASSVRSRARGLVANNPYACNGVANWVAALVGTGIMPTADADSVASFSHWCEFADADGRTDFFGLQAELGRALVVDGEAFVQLLETDSGLRLRLLPAELVDESRTGELSDGKFIVNGIEFAADGTREAYHVFPARPTDAFAGYAAPIRIPASQILHIFKPLGAGQVRGISWLATIVVGANELDAVNDALAVGVKVAALHAGFLIDQNGTGEPFEGDDISAVSLEPGTVRRLPHGFDIKFSAPRQANETAAFIRSNLQMLAAGLGLPEHLFSGDLTNANYSSLRAGLLPFRQRVEQVQYHTLVPQLLNPVWRRFFAPSVLGGDLAAVPRVEWLPPAWLQVDPEKAAKADAAELNAGLTSRKKLVAARGWNIEDLDAEIAADREREKLLGLSFGEPPKISPAEAPKKDETP